MAKQCNIKKLSKKDYDNRLKKRLWVGRTFVKSFEVAFIYSYTIRQVIIEPLTSEHPLDLS